MYLQGRLAIAGYRAAAFKTRTEASLVPTIYLEGVCVIEKILVHNVVCLCVSIVQINILPIFVQDMFKRNRQHHYCKCFVDAWNVAGQDSDRSR